jgi:hypothetical protein
MRDFVLDTICPVVGMGFAVLVWAWAIGLAAGVTW